MQGPRAKRLNRPPAPARALGLAALLLATVPAAAEVTPTPSAGDPHIQSVEYDPQQVVALGVASGYAVTVVFSPDERIETVTVGDSAAWQVQVNRRADAMVVKPVGFAPSTNLTVLSDQRTYNFTLSTGGGAFGTLPYLLRFTYPAADKGPEEPEQPQVNLYHLKGAHAIMPRQMSDDGVFTSIVWLADTPLPAVYRDEGKGHLALVNGTMRDGAFVIEGVYPKLVFVLDKAKATATRMKERDKP